MKSVIKTYAAYLNDEKIRLESSSGALFTALAKDCISKNGVVYGVAMRKDCYGAEFVRVKTMEELAFIRGSKYIQASMGNTYKNVKDDLERGSYVLFTGTGCQVNGLKKFLRDKYENLVAVDIVCHGTPSPKVWREYVKYQEDKYQGKMLYAGFRNKEQNHWEGFGMKEKIQGQHAIYLSRFKDPYFSFFVKNLSLRPSCYKCAAKEEKLSDISIADFWGIDEVAPDLNDDKGISLVITRTAKGQKVLNGIQDSLTMREVTYEQGIHQNSAEYKSHPCPENRKQFFSDLGKIPFEQLANKYLYVPIWKRGARKIKGIVKKYIGGGEKIKNRGMYSQEYYCLKFVFTPNGGKDDSKVI